MQNLILQNTCRQRGDFGSSFFLLVVVLVVLSTESIGQTAVFTDRNGNTTVTVDLRVLDQFGPPQSLPELYRTTGATPSSSIQGDQSQNISNNSNRRQLLPAPRGMPRSKLNVAELGASSNSVSGRKASSTSEATKLYERQQKKLARGKLPRPPLAVATPKVTSQTIVPRPPALSSKTNTLKYSSLKQMVREPPTKNTRSIPVSPPNPIKVLPTNKTTTSTATGKMPSTIPRSNSNSETIDSSVTTNPGGNFYSITFNPGSEELPQNSKKTLIELAARMKGDEDLRIQLKGYSGNNTGSASQARRSSLFRALAIRKVLMSEGVRSTRMDVRALGQKSVQGLSNDRVDIIVQN